MTKRDKANLMAIADFMCGGLVDIWCGHCGDEVHDLTRKRCKNCRHQLPRTRENR